jgi:ATP/maltotriose-dependent transcriptional regulator MalT
MGLCVKDGTGVVLHQNKHCLQSCGNQISKICSTGCMKLRSVSGSCAAFNEGVQLFRSEELGGEYYDLVLIDNGSSLTTLLYPLDKKYRKEIEFLSQFHLSPRELEIVSYLIRFEKNSDIAKELKISKATLKTHLNNIYRKLPFDVSNDLKERALKKASS